MKLSSPFLPVLTDKSSELVQYFCFIDEKTGQPIDGMNYRVNANNSVIADQRGMISGMTEEYAFNDSHGMLSITAWYPMEGRNAG